MPVPTYTVTCSRKTKIALDTYEFTFSKPEGFTYQPGQFVLFDVPHPDNSQDLQARAYSIASSPDEADLLFIIHLVPGGRMSRWIEERCQVGSTLVMKGPFGNFLLDCDPAKELLFICTGAGNAPFRSHIVHALAHGDTRRMDLLYGVRTEEHLTWVKAFEELSTRHANVHFHVALTQPSDAWTGLRGRVQTIVPTIVTDFSKKSVYVCGNPTMTKEVKDLCLGPWGIDKKNLHVEGYI